MAGKIAITTTTFAKFDKSPVELLKKRGYEVTLNDKSKKLNYDESLEICKGAVGIIAGTEVLDRKLLEKLPGLKVISRCGTGLENVDMKAAQSLGIKVVNTPDGPTDAVAELTIGLILAMLRKICVMDRDIRRGGWKKEMGNLLKGRRLGIIGFGRIGKKVLFLAANFGCEIAYADPKADLTDSNSKRMSLEELLEWADIVTVHASTKDMILGKKEIALLKSGSWIVNVSRGEVLDECALYEALKSGHLSGAALDVFNKEPYEGKLSKLDNIILTPHIGSYAKEARVKMETDAVKNLINALEGANE